jgi:hypothetical protein
MFAAYDGLVCVVVEVDELRAPPNEHRLARRKHDSHAGFQALRPGLDGSERSLAPIDLPHPGPHLASARENGLDLRRSKRRQGVHSAPFSSASPEAEETPRVRAPHSRVRGELRRFRLVNCATLLCASDDLATLAPVGEARHERLTT